VPLEFHTAEESSESFAGEVCLGGGWKGEGVKNTGHLKANKRKEEESKKKERRKLNHLGRKVSV
jgi:hypothetical protein